MLMSMCPTTKEWMVWGQSSPTIQLPITNFDDDDHNNKNQAKIKSTIIFQYVFI